MTPQTVTIITARGETFTMNFDGPVSVEVEDVHLSPFEVGDMTPRTQSTAPKFKVGNVVYWEVNSNERYYGTVAKINENRVFFQPITLPPDWPKSKNGLEWAREGTLHHDYRTVAGGGWRKCEVGKVYRMANGDNWTHCDITHDENGYSFRSFLDHLIEELP